MRSEEITALHERLLYWVAEELNREHSEARLAVLQAQYERLALEMDHHQYLVRGSLFPPSEELRMYRAHVALPRPRRLGYLQRRSRRVHHIGSRRAAQLQREADARLGLWWALGMPMDEARWQRALTWTLREESENFWRQPWEQLCLRIPRGAWWEGQAERLMMQRGEALFRAEQADERRVMDEHRARQAAIREEERGAPATPEHHPPARAALWVGEPPSPPPPRAPRPGVQRAQAARAVQASRVLLVARAPIGGEEGGWPGAGAPGVRGLRQPRDMGRAARAARAFFGGNVPEPMQPVHARPARPAPARLGRPRREEQEYFGHDVATIGLARAHALAAIRLQFAVPANRG